MKTSELLSKYGLFPVDAEVAAELANNNNNAPQNQNMDGSAE